MRILVIHPHLHFLGGSEILTKILVDGLAEMGHEVVVLSKDFRSDAFKEGKGITLRHIKRVSEGDTAMDRLVDLMCSFKEVINEFNDAVPFIMIQEPIYAVLLKTVKPSIKVGMYIHYPIEEEVTEENLREFIKNYRFPNMYGEFYKVIELHIVNSNYTAKAFYKFFGLTSNVIYPAIPGDYFSEEIEVRGREPVVISVGRFVPQKRLDTLIKWFGEKIKPEVPNAKLLVIGIPDSRYMQYYEKIKELSSKYKDIELIDRPLKPKALAKYYRMSRVYIHLRIGEHFGMAPVEAMTQGAVPILPKASGLAELISNGYNGYAYENDEEAIKYLIKLLSMSNEEYSKIARNALRSSWHFTPFRFTRDIANYLKLIAD